MATLKWYTAAVPAGKRLDVVLVRAKSKKDAERKIREKAFEPIEKVRADFLRKK